LLEKLNGGPLPELKFFNMSEIRIAGGEIIGVSTYSAYLSVDRAWVSLAPLDQGRAQFGSEVT
jgi:hypothetical protein